MGCGKSSASKLSQPGDWTVTVTALLGPGHALVLTAPIVIDAK